MPFLCSFVGYYLEVFEKLKIFCQKGYKKAFFNGYYLREEILKKEYGLRIKVEGDYAVFNYNITCDFKNPIVQEARGIILDIKSFEVVCWPFRKFGNYNESYADEIDWTTARVQERWTALLSSCGLTALFRLGSFPPTVLFALKTQEWKITRGLLTPR